MRILFILGMYYPRYSANGVCCKNIVDECVRRGWKVDCIVNAYLGNYESFELEGSKIHPIKPRLSYRLIEKGETNGYGCLSKYAIFFGNFLNKFQLLIHSKRWPLISKKYTNSFYEKASELLNQNKYDFVISAYTPIDCVLAGSYIKNEFPSVRFIPYFLDALAGGWGPHAWNSEKKERALRYWETKIADNADSIISMLSSKKYHEKNPIADYNKKRIFLDVPMLLEPIESFDEDKDTKILLYAGNISYPRRNPIPLLNIMELVCNNSNTKVFFAGTINNTKIFDPYIERTKGKIKLLGQIPHDKLMDLEKKIDCFINIGSDNPNTIACKIFEYMRFSKPIISTYSIEDEPSLKYLKCYSDSICIDEKEPSIRNAQRIIEFLFSERVSVDSAELKKAFYLNTPGAFADVLERIMKYD